MTEINVIFLIGIGFFLGILFSIGVLDKMYKELMKIALEEVGRKYSEALGMLQEKLGKEK